jgi:hypothetical protein
VALKRIHSSYWSRPQSQAAKLFQFPVTLTFAITDFKCQGQTYDRVIVDIRKPHGRGRLPAASAYVQLSRAKSLKGVSILRPFDASELRKPLGQGLLDELEWERCKDAEWRMEG